MEYTKCLSILFILSVVNCELCSDKYWGLFTSDTSLCQAYNGTFSVTAVNIDNDISNVLTPNAVPSCITSNTLSLTNGGVLQVKVYSKSVTVEDNLTVLVYEAKENNVVGRATLEAENRVSDGWTVLEVILEGEPYYDGYIVLVGTSSPTSDILVKSVCYYPEYQQNDMNALQTASSVDRNKFQENDIEPVMEKSFRIFNNEDFWTPLTISLAVIIPVIVLALLSWACFALGKRQAVKQDPQVYEDIDNLPKPYLVPRVKSVYAESFTSATYGDRNNNIYSV